MRDTLKFKILVTPITFGNGDPELKSVLEKSVREVVYNPMNRPLTAPELLPLIKDVDGFIAGLDYIDYSVIQAARRLKVISRYGVGVDRVDIPAATEKGIVVANTPGANATAVAEFTIALILALGRDICHADRAIRRGEWPKISGVCIKGKTVGLVGFGAIGREVASRLKGFGCRVLVSDPAISFQSAGEHGVHAVSLAELLNDSDFVSLHASLTPETAGMVNKGFLSKMKQGAFLVNTARGELIDEEALRSALEEGLIRGAALDCFTQEPPPIDNPLFQLPQVLVTPHVAAHTDEAMNTMGWMAMQACLAVLRGERWEHTLNPKVYEKWRPH